MTGQTVRILVVEDEEYQWDIYRRVLTDYDLTCVSSLEAAREELSQTPYDLVILDLRLQRDHPRGTAGAVQQTQAQIGDVLDASVNSSVPLIVMSAYLDDTSKDDPLFHREQLRAVLPKSGNIENLREAVRRALREPSPGAFAAEEQLAEVYRLVGWLEQSHQPGHSDNVQRMAVCLAREVGLAHFEIQAIDILGALHDTDRLGIGEEVHKLLLRSWEWGPLAEASRLLRTLITYPRRLSLDGALRPRAALIGHFYERWATGRIPVGPDDLAARMAEIIAAADAAEVFSRARGVTDVKEIKAQVAHLLGRTFSDEVMRALVKCCKGS